MLVVVSALTAAITAVASSAAAYAAWRSARRLGESIEANRLAAEGQVLLRLLEIYSAPEMAHALRALRQWSDKHGEGFAEAYETTDHGSSEFHEVDAARRRVSHFFGLARRLHRSGSIRDHVAREVLAVSGTSILLDIVEPLEASLNKQYDQGLFQWVRAWGTPAEEIILGIPPKPAVKAVKA